MGRRLISGTLAKTFVSFRVTILTVKKNYNYTIKDLNIRYLSAIITHILCIMMVDRISEVFALYSPWVGTRHGCEI